MSSRFQVDLIGMVDLLSRHLYSGPQVYLRELLQNAVDAVTARRAADPDCPGEIRLRPGSDSHGNLTLEVTDTGIGLTADSATDLLATIGRSSKRDTDFGLARTEFIGQFGIGLLAAFMVADRIEVRSRSVESGAEPILWVGNADGTFEVSTVSDQDLAIGTTVRLSARQDSRHWFDPDAIYSLAREFGELLPFDVAVATGEDGNRWTRVSQPEMPWARRGGSQAQQDRELVEYCERVFGFTPLGQIPLEVPLAGVTGVAFILPQAVSPGAGQHRVYTKSMLLGARVDRVLPDWAFFVRAVINSDTLSPTASREQLHDDEVLLAVREALGGQIKNWAAETLRTPSEFGTDFMRIHHLALRALATTDDDMLELVAEVLPFETTDSLRTLRQAGASGEIIYTTTTEAYRRISAVARAQGLVVVNAGYVYDGEIMAKLQTKPGWKTRELASDDLVQVLRKPSVQREMALAAALTNARGVLAEQDCDVIVRSFSPAAVPAVLLRDSEGEHRRSLQRERSSAPDLWGDLLGSLAGQSSARTRTLVLNDDAPVARKLLAAPPGEIFDAGLSALYLSAVMLAGEGLRVDESAALADSLGVLLDTSLNTPSAGVDSEDQA